MSHLLLQHFDTPFTDILMYSQTDVQIKEERPNRPPPTSSPPPLLSPELPLTLQPLRSTPPVPPNVKLSQDISAMNSLYTKVHAENLQDTSAASPANIVFLNSEQGEYFLPEGSEAAASDSSTDDHDAG